VACSREITSNPLSILLLVISTTQKLSITNLSSLTDTRGPQPPNTKSASETHCHKSHHWQFYYRNCAQEVNPRYTACLRDGVGIGALLVGSAARSGTGYTSPVKQRGEKAKTRVVASGAIASTGSPGHGHNGEGSTVAAPSLNHGLFPARSERVGSPQNLSRQPLRGGYASLDRTCFASSLGSTWPGSCLEEGQDSRHQRPAHVDLPSLNHVLANVPRHCGR
jgi:hypothetical protein